MRWGTGCGQEGLDIYELKYGDWSQLSKLCHKTKVLGKTRIENEVAGVKYSHSLSNEVDGG